MKPRARTLVVLALLALAVICAALVFIRGKPNPRPPLPVPNGYDTFVQGAAVVSRDAGWYTDLDVAGLRELVTSNSNALRLVRTAFTQSCVVPPHYITNYDSGITSDLMEQLPAFKCIAQVLAAEGRLAELESRPADAARSYLDCIRFGNEISRGGPLISRLVGMACESIGYQPLIGLLPGLSPRDWANVAAKLEDVRLASVSWEEVWQTENASLRGFVRLPHYFLLARWKFQPAKRKAQQKDNRIVAQLSLLSTELALRCYWSENGNLPATLEGLTPKFLKLIPPDPFSKRPLIYRPQGTNWLLYSVGPDLKDDGGVLFKKGSPRTVKTGPPLFSDMVPAGDIFYDTMW